MTDQEAYQLIDQCIQYLKARQWGQLTIEVNAGQVKRINITMCASEKGVNHGSSKY